MLWTLSYITQLYKRTKHLGFKNTGWSGKAIHSDEKRQLLQFLQQPRNHCSWRARFVYSFKCCVGWKFKTGKKTSAKMTFILHSLTCSTAWLKGVFISIHRLLLVRGGAALSLPYVLQLSHKSLVHKEKLLCVCEKDHIPLTYQMIWLARWQTFCTTFHTLCWYSWLEQPNRSVKINKYQSQCSR